MTTQRSLSSSSRTQARIAILGLGGLGCPAAWALAAAKAGTLILIDDDLVDRTNLHRQILFRECDVGRSKVDAAAEALRRMAPHVHVETHKARFQPDTISLIDNADIILECTDRYAVKFLAADAAYLLHKPIVHGAAIRWIGTAMLVGPQGRPCYRCLFEDLPLGAQQTCDISGVVGPICGIIGAIQAHLALRALEPNEVSSYGSLAAFDGRKATDSLRIHTLRARSNCALCSNQSQIHTIERSRYSEPCT